MSRRKVADWSAGVLAVAVLAFGGLIVVKPAVDSWSDVYRADPFAGGTSTKSVAKFDGRTETTTTTEKASATERVLGNSGVLILRLILVTLAAFLAAAVLQRVILGNYGLRTGRSEAQAVAADHEDLIELEEVTGEEPAPTPVATRNGPDAAQEASGTNLAPPIAKLVASRREELGFSQRELAKRAGISHTVISRIEQGQHTPSRKTLERLADALRAAR